MSFSFCDLFFFFPVVGESKMKVNLISIKDGFFSNKETHSRSFSPKHNTLI